MSNLDTVLAFLQGKGLTAAQAAGVAGNLQVESGINPTSVNAAEGAVGIAQWEGGRRAALDSYAASSGGSEKDLTTQLNFLWRELQGTESNAYRKLVATSDPGSAAAAFDQYYERSSGSSRSTRVADAQAIAAGQPVNASSDTGSGSSGSSSAALGSGLMASIAGLALKVGAGVVAGALVVVGMKETMRGSAA